MSPTLFPLPEPFDQGWLDAGQGHRLYYEQCGRPDGMPAVFLHGGPGSSINANHRRFFDPAYYRIVLFDQRGCGRSTPCGETAANTTLDLIGDLEQLRKRLGIERWLLFGGSWGSTLALAYGQAHPERVAGMILRGVFLASPAELDWYLLGLRRFVPEAWARFAEGAPADTAEHMVEWFAQRLIGGDSAVALSTARRWSNYESALMAVGEAPGAGQAVDDAALLARARVQLHYLRHDCFLAPNQLLHGMSRLAELSGVIVQGRRDLVCPPLTAHTLHLAWPGSHLHIVEEGGHSAMHPAMASALVTATERMKLPLREGQA
jgi:proline iminopeptidase